jgi:hypothetical protein
MAKTAATGLTHKHSSDAWAIFNILKVLHSALPDDSFDAEIPTRCLVAHLVDLSEQLADALSELPKVPTQKEMSNGQ